jgi:hypothetical protein
MQFVIVGYGVTFRMEATFVPLGCSTLTRGEPFCWESIDRGWIRLPSPEGFDHRRKPQLSPFP